MSFACLTFEAFAKGKRFAGLKGLPALPEEHEQNSQEYNFEFPQWSQNKKPFWGMDQKWYQVGLGPNTPYLHVVVRSPPGIHLDERISWFLSLPGQVGRVLPTMDIQGFLVCILREYSQLAWMTMAWWDSAKWSSINRLQVYKWRETCIVRSKADPHASYIWGRTKERKTRCANKREKKIGNKSS